MKSIGIEETIDTLKNGNFKKIRIYYKTRISKGDISEGEMYECNIKGNDIFIDAQNLYIESIDDELIIKHYNVLGIILF